MHFKQKGVCSKVFVECMTCFGELAEASFFFFFSVCATHSWDTSWHSKIKENLHWEFPALTYWVLGALDLLVAQHFIAWRRSSITFNSSPHALLDTFNKWDGLCSLIGLQLCMYIYATNKWFESSELVTEVMEQFRSEKLVWEQHRRQTPHPWYINGPCSQRDSTWTRYLHHRQPQLYIFLPLLTSTKTNSRMNYLFPPCMKSQKVVARVLQKRWKFLKGDNFLICFENNEKNGYVLLLFVLINPHGTKLMHHLKGINWDNLLFFCFVVLEWNLTSFFVTKSD